MRLLKSTIRLIIVAVMLVAVAVGQNGVDAFDKYVEAARVDWKVPGMSVVVVRDGKVMLSKGYGQRELGKADAVNNETLFGAMSTTKAMVAVAMGVLVDEGKVSWDDHVIKHLPGFRVADPYVTSELRVRDLFTHTGGMGNADFLWARGELTAGEIVSRMQYAKPAYPFRGGFIYQNVMYLVAGQVIEKASGMSWERFMTTRVFEPLGMKNTFPTLASTNTYRNKSKAHFEIKREVTVIPEMAVDAAAPAGAVWSTSDDMGKWIAFLLGNSKLDKPLLKSATHSELFKPQVILPANFYPTFSLTKPKWTTYGLGWFQHDYRGEMVNFHTGSLAGRTAIVGLLRDKNTGVYIFGNIDHVEVRHALMYKAFDVFGFGDDKGRDWSAEMKTLYDGLAAAAASRMQEQQSRKLPETKPSLPIAAYAGTYSDPFYGTMEIQVVDGALQMIAGKELWAKLAHRNGDTFSTDWNRAWMGEGIATFQVDSTRGQVAALITGGGTFKRQNR